MRVQDLQLFLSKFTEGSDAIKNAQIYVEREGKLYLIRRMEVHEHAVPIIGHSGHTAHRYHKYLGLDLKIIVYMALPIYWAIIILATFSH